MLTERILLSRAGGGTGPLKPGNLQRHDCLREGANLEQGVLPWTIRVKGAFEIMPFLMCFLRERKAFLYG